MSFQKCFKNTFQLLNNRSISTLKIEEWYSNNLILPLINIVHFDGITDSLTLLKHMC